MPWRRPPVMPTWHCRRHPTVGACWCWPNRAAVRGRQRSTATALTGRPHTGGRGPGGRTTDMTVAHAGSGPVPVAAYTPVFGASSARHAVPVALKPSVVVRKSSPYGAVAVAAAGPGAAGVVASQASLIPYGPGRG